MSVVVPCYNAAPYICETLESVYQQASVDLDVIVVDDASDDESAALVAQHFPAAVVVQLPTSGPTGPSAARNAGTLRAKYGLIQYLDADDLLAPGKLARQARELESASADVAYGDWAKFTVDAAGCKLIQHPVQEQLSESAADLDMFRGFWCPPAAYLFRRSIVDRIGGWRTNLPVIQDARFALDCALHGARFCYSPGLSAYYRAHAAGSVSTRSRASFLNDCLANAAEVCEWWRTRGLLDDARRRAVADVANMVARGSVRLDRHLFERACRMIDEVWPQFVPSDSVRFGWAARTLGYRRAALLVSKLRSTAR